MPELNCDALREMIRSAREDLLDRAVGLTDEALRMRPSEDEWSIIEVLAHLADVDRHWLAQALAIRDKPAHVFVHFDDARWRAEHAEVRREALTDIEQKMRAAHSAVLRTLAHLSVGDLSRAGKHPRGTPYTVRDVFLRYPAHDRNPAEQISSIRDSLGV
jgi:hypothetical protein